MIDDSMNHAVPGSSPLIRHEIHEGDTLLGFVDYQVFGDHVILTHTETNPALPGKGHGSRLAERVIDDLREQEKRIVPICGFFANYLRKRPEHHAMLTPEARKLLDIDSNS